METRYFQHFKGGLYKLISIGRSSENQEPVVIYQALYGNKDVWVRPYGMFFEKVKTESGEVDRFREISEEEYNKFKE